MPEVSRVHQFVYIKPFPENGNGGIKQKCCKRYVTQKKYLYIYDTQIAWNNMSLIVHYWWMVLKIPEPMKEAK